VNLRRGLAATAALIALAAAPAPDTRAQAPADLEARTSEVARELRCPTCQGLSIEDSPSDLARDMRATVRDQLAAGRSPEQVKAYFVGRYGEWVLLEPEASGFNLFVYLLPVLALLLGLGIVLLAVRRWVEQGGSAAAASGDHDGTAVMKAADRNDSRRGR
jgi:cytochrome c-type biogenesis protein CcmH